jgi:hypothetical protein
VDGGRLIKDPLILFDELKKRKLLLHFDMHHGYGNLDLAIKLLDADDKNDFNTYVNTNTKFNPHIMFIAKPEISTNGLINYFLGLKDVKKNLDLKIFQATTPKDCMRILLRDTYLFGLKNILCIKSSLGHLLKIRRDG